MREDKMTLFYSKRTGEIKAYTTGVTDMGYFGEDKEDMSVIYDFIVVDRDDYVVDNIEQFKIIDEKIKLKEITNLDKYL